jgi:pimeloyl-ACP methyl ester carboxylesterase
VVRQFEHRGGSELQVGMRAALDSRVYPGDPLTGLGIPFAQVTYAGELGEYPAWFVPGDRATWFIFVHGNGMTPRDGLRILPTVVDAGLPVLVITYRGDDGAPRAPDDRLTYGKGEWHDLDAAVRYARDHGAESVVIEGMSMGGAVTMAFLLESPLADMVRAVVFDAPVLDLERAVEFQAQDERLPLVGLPLPGTLVDSAEWIAAQRYGVDWGYNGYMDRTGELAAPIFLVHGTDDDDISVEASAELARTRPDLVRDFYRAPGAGHVEAWNVDPAEYERRLLAFLAGVGALE